MLDNVYDRYSQKYFGEEHVKKMFKGSTRFYPRGLVPYTYKSYVF